MKQALIGTALRRLSAWMCVGLCVSVVVVSAGCPGGATPPDDNVNDNDDGSGDSGELSGEIISFSTFFSMSKLDPAASVTYSVTGTPDTISGFFVPVADADPGAGEIGDRQIAALNLPATGPNMRFNFDPTTAGVGFFRVGITMTLGDQTVDATSAGVIQVEGPPDPVFIRPVDAITDVVQGAEIPVSFDAGDPENDVQWRLFYLSESDARNNQPDELGTLLAAGRGNFGSTIFATAGLESGDYELGLSATDSGSSISATVAAGKLDRIITVFGPVIHVVAQADIEPPSLRFTEPGMSNVALYKNEAYTIEFTVTITEPEASGSVELFYDDDNKLSNGFRGTIAENLPDSRTSFPFPTSEISEGTWYIGGTVFTVGGISGPVTTYANGTIEIVREPTLTVVEPSSPLPVAPSTPVTIAWTTNAPPSAGTVTVSVRAVGTGEITNPVSDGPLSETSTTFEEELSGLYEITVRLDFIDGDSLSATAPVLLRISSLPRILWLGSLAEPDPPFAGAIFGGANFRDNAGTAFSTVNDINGDGLHDFVVVARYGSPFFENDQGIGAGEAYLIFGQSGAGATTGEFNLNSVGTSILPGVTFTGIRTPQGNNETDGMSSASRIPDVDGDGRDELVFGFPDTASRGHNVSPLQNGVIHPFALATLEREDQFLRGGIVIVSSQNSALSEWSIDNTVINLDLVGQDFDVTCVEEDPDPPDDSGDFFVNVHDEPTGDPGEPGCDGTCDDPNSGGKPDATEFIDHGFVAALARDYFSTYVYSVEFFRGVKHCDSPTEFVNHECLTEVFPPVLHEYCADFVAACEPFSPGLFGGGRVTEWWIIPIGSMTFDLPVYSRYSGFYPERIEIGGEDATNFAREPYGARIIGLAPGNKFGTSLTMSSGSGSGAVDLIVSSPGRTARGIELGPDGGPEAGGEIDTLGTQSNSDSGVAYMFSLRSLWTDSGFWIPPKPHQYIVGAASHCSGPDPLIDNVDAIRIAGLPSDRIRNIIGIDDFNNDGRDDFAIGAPAANAGAGRVYIAYRREPAIEGDYVLDKLALDPNDPERLDGMLIVADSITSFGSSLAGDMDFNGDGFNDLVIGSPDASGGIGEVIIVFSNTGLVSPLNGISVDTLLSTRANNRPVAARIVGNFRDADGQFGFNVANAGDVDDDNADDLLIAAPGASPRFDPTPSDADDSLTELGLDLDFDGVQDELEGVDDDDLTDAGIVYVLSSKNLLSQIRTCADSGRACSIDADCEVGEACSSTTMTIGIDQLGTSQLRGFMIVGRRPGDQIGGGDAGDSNAGGIESKRDRGRSFGLATAGDVDGDGRDDILIGSVVADPRIDQSGTGVVNGGEAYLIYGSAAP